MVLEGTLRGVVIVDAVKEFLIEVGPFLKGKFLTEDAGTHVERDKCCLDEKGAGTAHRVDEVARSIPASHAYHAGSQHLVDWGLYVLLAVAPTME